MASAAADAASSSSSLLPPPGFWLHSLALHPVADLSNDLPDHRQHDSLLLAPDATLPDLSIINPDPAVHKHALDDDDDDGDEDDEHNINVARIDLGSSSTPHYLPMPPSHRRESLIAVHEGLAVVCLNATTTTTTTTTTTAGTSSSSSHFAPRLRLVNLRRWKGLLDETNDDLDVALQAADYKELDVPNVTFRVKHIELNATGRHLALAGDTDVAIVVLPRAIWSDQRHTEVIKVSSWLLEFRRFTQVVKVQWHPLSEKHVHLMVLSVDGTLGLHDVTAGQNSLEKSYYFFGSSHGAAPTNRSGMFGPDLDEEDFVSFCTARNDGKWGSMTVYGVTRSGDVYALCPVLPKRSIMTQESLDYMRREALATRAEQAARGAYSQTQAYWQTTMIDELLLESRRALESLPGEPFSLTIPRTAISLKTKARGPHLFRPTADVSVDFDEACDITTLSPEAPGIDVVLLSFRSGMVRVCVDVEGPRPSWHIEKQPIKDEAALPLLLVVEDIDLGLSPDAKTIPMSLVPDPRHAHIVYAYHAHGVHCINVGPVLCGLETLAGSAEAMEVVGSKLQTELDHENMSEVNLLISTEGAGASGNAAVIGFSVITETSLGYSYVLMTSLPQLYGDALAVPIKHRCGNESSSASTINMRKAPASASTTTTASTSYVPVLEAPLYQIPAVMRKQAPTIKSDDAAAILPLDVPLSRFSSAPPLLAFFEHIKARRGDLLDRHFAVLDLERRVTHQQVEMKKQQSVVQLWEDLIDKQADTQIGTLQHKLEELRVKEYLHRKRLGITLQILMDETQPLTDAEKRWIKELGALQRAFEEKMRPFMTKIESQLAALHARRETLQRERNVQYASARAPDLGEQQRRRIDAALKQEYELLVVAAQRVERLKDAARKVQQSQRLRGVSKALPKQQAVL
ncbi:hypothetical protein HDU87_007771 [Geranomyces variabilis]|uniref:Nucleoporin Nup82 n=1 Tax=Geranomyces variabilis TaxID=109894 RepID=A0AAD5TF91_9FUNG|nr:hypothetical protein HDU87_007771 [Geranomyces variabilis]